MVSDGGPGPSGTLGSHREAVALWVIGSAPQRQLCQHVRMRNRTPEEMQAGLDHILQSPKDDGRLEMVVMRPEENERKILESAELHPDHGVVGDNWATRGSGLTDDGSAHPNMQLNIINARLIGLLAGDRERWALAGDQLYVDFDLSEVNAPPWTQLVIGEAVVEITDQPHRGCAKFSQRFGVEALRWVNSDVGKALHLRGLNARVVQAGTVLPGDRITKRL